MNLWHYIILSVQWRRGEGFESTEKPPLQANIVIDSSEDNANNKVIIISRHVCINCFRFQCLYVVHDSMSYVGVEMMLV